MTKFLVTGATGQLGSAVANELLRKVNASDISVLVKDIANCEESHSL